MRTKLEDRWQCTNPACGCEVLVERGGSKDGKNPRCACGAAMKKRYVSPVLTYLEFLRVDETVDVASRKD
jgi:hypothetical protein